MRFFFRKQFNPSDPGNFPDCGIKAYPPSPAAAPGSWIDRQVPGRLPEREMRGDSIPAILPEMLQIFFPFHHADQNQIPILRGLLAAENRLLHNLENLAPQLI